MTENEPVHAVTRGSIMRLAPYTPRLALIASQVASFTRTTRGDAGGERIDLFLKHANFIETFSGLLPRFQKVLRDKGIPLTVKHLIQRELKAFPEELSAEDLEYIRDREDQTQVLGLIGDHPGGFLVEAPTGWGKSFVVRYVCRLFKEARIAIVTPGVDLVDGMYTHLRERLRDVGAVSMNHSHIDRVTVSTVDSMEKLREIKWDLMLFDEAHRAGSPWVANAIAETFHTAKCVGFSASPVGRTDNADLVVEALFGPVIYRVSYQEGVNRGAVAPIKVEMYRCKVGPDCSGSDAVVRNRHGIWRNKHRNKMIADICKSLPANEQALIIVGTAEHAIRLHGLLPGWPVVFSSAGKRVMKAITKGDLPWVAGLEPSGNIPGDYREKMRQDFESGKLKRAIATGVWNTGVDFTKLRWLIRADGMASAIQSIQTPGRLSRKSDGKVHGTLIDFQDEFDSGLRNRSAARKRQYASMGWSVHVVDMETGRIQEYKPRSRSKK